MNRKCANSAVMTFLLVFQGCGAFPAMSQSPSYSVTVATAKSVDYSLQISAFGTVQPDPTRVSTLVTMVSGIVQRVDIRPGQSISKGDMPVTLHTDPNVRTQVIQTRDAIRLAEETLGRVQPLYEKGLALKNDVDNAQRDLADAKARLAELNATGALESDISPAAPADGLVTNVLVKVGDQVPAGAALVQAADPAALTIRIGVEAADVPSLPVGTPVAITAITGLEAGDPTPPMTSSTVSAIERVVDPQTRLAPVWAVVSGDKADGFLIGQAVRARFETGKVPAIKVPHAALLYAGSTPIVFVVDNGSAVRRAVTLVDASADWVFLKDGIRDGETVVTGGQTGLQDGAAVRVAK